MEKGRDKDSFRTSTDIYSGYDTDYDFSFENTKPIEYQMPPQEEEAREKPKRKRKKRKKKHYFLRFLVLVALIAAAYMFLTSSIFEISEVRIEDNTLLSDDEIIEMSGVEPGDNMFKETNGKVKKALTKDPYISDVKIKRKLPNIYIISVVERTPVMSIQHGGKYVILDADGYAVDENSDSLYSTIITGVRITKYKLGEKPTFSDSAKFKEVSALVNGVNASGMYFKKVEITDSLTIKGYVTDTLMCSGAPDSILENLESIKSILFDLEQKGIKRGIIKVGDDGYATFSPVTE